MFKAQEDIEKYKTLDELDKAKIYLNYCIVQIALKHTINYGKFNIMSFEQFDSNSTLNYHGDRKIIDWMVKHY